MVRNRLEDRVVEPVRASAVVRSIDPLPENAVTLIFKERRLWMEEPGVYRASADTPVSGMDEPNRWAEHCHPLIVAWNLGRTRQVRRRHHYAGPFFPAHVVVRTW